MHRPARQEWRALAPMPTIQRSSPALLDGEFPGSLATRARPLFLADLGHRLDHDAPSGLVGGLAAPTGPQAGPHLAGPHPAAPAPVQRSFGPPPLAMLEQSISWSTATEPAQPASRPSMVTRSEAAPPVATPDLDGPPVATAHGTPAPTTDDHDVSSPGTAVDSRVADADPLVADAGPVPIVGESGPVRPLLAQRAPTDTAPPDAPTAERPIAVTSTPSPGPGGTGTDRPIVGRPRIGSPITPPISSPRADDRATDGAVAPAPLQRLAADAPSVPGRAGWTPRDDSDADRDAGPDTDAGTDSGAGVDDGARPSFAAVVPPLDAAPNDDGLPTVPLVGGTGPVVADATGPVVADATGPVVADATGPVVGGTGRARPLVLAAEPGSARVEPTAAVPPPTVARTPTASRRAPIGAPVARVDRGDRPGPDRPGPDRPGTDRPGPDQQVDRSAPLVARSAPLVARSVLDTATGAAGAPADPPIGRFAPTADAVRIRAWHLGVEPAGDPRDGPVDGPSDGLGDRVIASPSFSTPSPTTTGAVQRIVAVRDPITAVTWATAVDRGVSAAPDRVSVAPAAQSPQRSGGPATAPSHTGPAVAGVAGVQRQVGVPGGAPMLRFVSAPGATTAARAATAGAPAGAAVDDRVVWWERDEPMLAASVQRAPAPDGPSLDAPTVARVAATPDATPDPTQDATTPGASTTVTAAATPAAAGTGRSEAELLELVRALYPPLQRRLCRDLLLDRERAGYRTDIRF
ncbi:MAG: hypothetical protein ABW328_13735 [Ilumatobacteraceae bacterium]